MIHKWPGNVRELRNAAERFVLTGDTSGFDLTGKIKSTDGYSNKPLPEKIDLFERALIEQALSASRGCIKVVMERLGLPRKTLYDKMKKYGLDKALFK
jgi:two-component system C4-dicarboxylate transport response regulator DctD